MGLPNEPVIKKFYTNKIESSRSDWYEYLIQIARIFYSIDGQEYKRELVADKFSGLSPRSEDADRDSSNFRDEFGAYGSFLGVFRLEKENEKWYIRVSEATKSFLCCENSNAAAFLRAQLSLFQYPNGMGAVISESGSVSVQGNVKADTLRELQNSIRLNPFRLICKIVVALVEEKKTPLSNIALPYSLLLCMFNDDRINQTYSPDSQMIMQVYEEYSAPDFSLPAKYLEVLTNFKRNFHILEKTGLFVRDSQFGLMVSQINYNIAYACIRLISGIDMHFDAFDQMYGHVDEREVRDIIAENKWGNYYDGGKLSTDILVGLGAELPDAPIQGDFMWNPDEWRPFLSEYDPGLSAQEYHDLFVDTSIVKRTWLVGLYELYQMPGHLATCVQLGERYGYAPSHYISYLSSIATNIAKKTGCPLERDEDRVIYWPVLFVGKHVKGQGAFCWKMREPVVEAMEMIIDESVFDSQEDERMTQFDHNMILYGPPGTGKTYHSMIYAVAICDGKTLDEIKEKSYSDVMVRYRELRDSGRIAFTTFHQSYGYEEFIEGIKPKLDDESDNLGYMIEDGVFKEFCQRAKAVKVQAVRDSKIKPEPRIWGMILGGTGMTDLKKHCFENNEIRLGWSEVDDDDVNSDFSGDEKVSWNGKHMVSDFKNVMEPGDIVIIEKSNKAIDAIGVITGEYEYDRSLGKYPRRRTVDWLVKGIDQNVIPYLPNGRKQLSRYSLFSFDYIGMDAVSQILSENSDGPTVEVEQETKPYVFIIDEINRGNISKIFGELITLIEDTKRAGAEEAMEVILPYSGDTFSVPKNVFILGTMNTADRSIALMDTALRRRFEFEEMMPDSEVLESLGIGTIIVDGEELSVSEMLNTINRRIKYLFDREHTIGHAFFTKLAVDPSMETLANIFEKNVIPLLQEYFYEDYEKIQLVLGDNTKPDEYKFVLDTQIDLKNDLNGNPDIDLPEKSYEIQREAFRRLMSYKLIGKGL